MARISYAMNVLNGEPFIKYQLDSIYAFAHEIIIVEGAYSKFRHAATLEGRSLDSTIKSIRNYPDRLSKIKLISKPGFYEDRLEMCNEFLKHVTGDYLWQVDADEFYLPQTHQYIAELLTSDSTIDRVSVNFVDLFARCNYFVCGYESVGLQNVNRIFQFTPGDQWGSQRPPYLIDKNGIVKETRRYIDGAFLQNQGHVMFHATLLFENQVRDKYRYYSSMWKSITVPSIWMKHVWNHLSNKFNIAGLNTCVTYLQRYKGPEIESLSALWSDIESGKFPNIRCRDIDDIEEYLNSPKIQLYTTVARDINQYVSNQRIRGNPRGVTITIIRLLLLRDLHTGLFAFMILIGIMKSTIFKLAKNTLRIRNL